MRTSKITVLAVAGALGVTGLGAVAVGGPALAASAPQATATEDGTGEDTSWLADRVSRITEALSGLVGDGTITQDQADKVASALGGSDALRGGPGMGLDMGAGMGHDMGAGMGHDTGAGLDSAATALGLTPDEVRTGLEAGKSLADLAGEQGVDVQQVIDALVADATARIDQRLAAGDLTQERADAMKSGLADRVAERVQNARPGGDGHHGPGGQDMPDGDDAGGDASADSSVQDSIFRTA